MLTVVVVVVKCSSSRAVAAVASKEMVCLTLHFLLAPFLVP